MTIRIDYENYDKIIIAKFENKEWVPRDIDVQYKIHKEWEKKIKRYDNIWSSPMVRLDNVRQEDRILHLDTSLTEYKFHAGTRNEKDKENRANPIYVSANIITSDDKLVFGLRDNSDRGNGQYNIAAGAMHPILDGPDGYPSPGIALYREIFEEFGLIPESFKNVKPEIAFSIDDEPTLSFLYTIRLGIDSEDVEKKLKASIKRSEEFGMKPEMVDLKLVENDPKIIRRELETNGDSYRPMVQAMMEYLSR